MGLLPMCLNLAAKEVTLFPPLKNMLCDVSEATS